MFFCSFEGTVLCEKWTVNFLAWEVFDTPWNTYLSQPNPTRSHRRVQNLQSSSCELQSLSRGVYARELVVSHPDRSLVVWLVSPISVLLYNELQPIWIWHHRMLNTNTYGNPARTEGRTRTWKTEECTEGERCGLNVCVVPSLNGRGLSI